MPQPHLCGTGRESPGGFDDLWYTTVTRVLGVFRRRSVNYVLTEATRFQRVVEAKTEVNGNRCRQVPGGKGMRMSDSAITDMTDRATKVEVMAALIRARDAMREAGEVMSRRYGSGGHAGEIMGAAALIDDDWLPGIMMEGGL